MVELGDGDTMVLYCKVFLRQDNIVSLVTPLRSYFLSPGILVAPKGPAVPDLLTVGSTTYTGDTQVMSAFSYPDNWGIRMVDVQEKDSGLYG